MADSTGVSLTFGSALIRSLALGRALGRELGPEPYVGLMVPPSVPAAVANIALLMLGKIPINLNYSASQAVIDAAVDQAGIKHVVTSRKVLEKVHLDAQGDAGLPGRHARRRWASSTSSGRRSSPRSSRTACWVRSCPA